MSSNRLSLMIGAALCLGVGMLPTSALHAQAAVQGHYSIAAGSLGDVLDTFATQSHLQVVYAPGLVAGKTSAGLSGNYPPAQALGRLLQGTGLSAQAINAGTYVIKSTGLPPRKPAPAAATASTVSAAAASAPTTNLAAVRVTGSLIRSVDVAPAQPVVTITAQDIQHQGFATVGQLLQNITSASTPDISKSDPAEGGPDVGGTYVDLRGLGTQRTLVLIDGKRMGASFDGDSNLDTIPASIIDHIDVLADGASAIYGSDAIAGVINIITKKDYNGVEINTYYGRYLPHGDGDQGQTSITWGKSTSRGSIIFSAQYQNQDAIGAGRRPYSNYPLTNLHPLDGLSPLGPYGQISNGGSTLILNNGGDPRNIDDYHQQISPTYGANGGAIAAGDTYNLNYANDLQSATNMKNLFTQGHYDLLDNLTASFSASYNETGNTGLLEGYPLSTAGLAGDTEQPQFNGLTLSPNSYYYPYNYNAEYGTPGQAPQGIDFARVIIEDPRLSINKTENYRFRAGLDGHFSLGEHQFDWDAYYYDTRSQGTITDTGNFYLPNLAQALGPSFLGANGTVQCGTPGNVIAGCVPLNILAGPGGITQDMLNYLNTLGYERYGSVEKGPQVDLSGDLYELPGGDLTFAAGLDHRSISGYDTPDVPSAEGLTTNLAGLPTAGSYGVNEAFGELNLPLLQNLPFAKSLNLDFAGRISKYSDFGTARTNSIKLSWQPFNDLLVRASYGTGFRAPTVGDLYGGVTTSYNPYNDPCDMTFGLARYNATVAQNCVNGIGGQPALNKQALAALQNASPGEFANGFIQEQAPGTPVTAPGGAPVYGPFTQGGNPNLKAETSDNAQVGFVYSPSWLVGFNATVDWYKYKIRNVISSVGTNEVLDNCYQLGDLDDCGKFQRLAANNYQITGLFTGEENQGYLETSGYDFNFSYQLPKLSFGQFRLNWASTYISKFNQLTYPGVPVNHEAGFASDWRLRSTFSVAWNYRDFGATWSLRYFSPLKAGCYNPQASAFPCTLPNYYSPGTGISPTTQVTSVTFNDLQVYWNTPWNATISLGANNVFNRVAPYFYNGSGSDSSFAYNASYDLGRFVYVRYSQKLF